MKLLRAKLLQLEEQRNGTPRGFTPAGEPDWTCQVRHYTLQPFTLARDIRTGMAVDEVQDVLDGNLDAFTLASLWRGICREPASLGRARQEPREGSTQTS